MTKYRILGYSQFMSKNGKPLTKLCVAYITPGSRTTGYDVDNFVCSTNVITGGVLKEDLDCNIIFNKSGYVDEVVLLQK